MALRLRIERRRPPLLRFFSSSSSPDDKDKDSDPQPSSISSHFSDVKATLKHQHSEDRPLRRPTPRPPFLSRPQRQQPTPEFLEAIRKRLSEFRPHVVPPPAPSAQSFQKFYQHNDLGNNDNAQSPRNAAKTSLDGIRESLRGISDSGNASAPGRDGQGFSGGDRMSLSRFTETLRLRPEEGDKAASRKSAGGGGKGETLPLGIFGKEIKEKNEAKAGKQKDSLEKTKFLKSYEYEELGEKLRMLRNTAEERMKGFSLKELNERLVRLKEMEEKEMETRSKNSYWSGLRDTLMNMNTSEGEKERNDTLHRLEILGSLGGAPVFMRHPPKEHLFEKYFHPDNMSSSEKLKIQLANVRDEFKMSESDCGSARVQVAQLTTKIKHLSSVLHKKDKHSRKGLDEMVQRRKRLLKYLRNTDWDSYTMVLSKLGLRDNTLQARSLR